MSGQHQLADDARQRMERQLAQHYGEPVIPISRSCNSIFAWLDALTVNHAPSTEVRGPDGGGLGTALPGADTNLTVIAAFWKEHGPKVRLSAYKSALLARLLYANGVVRETPCPVHKGRWSGIGQVACGCHDECGNVTGWLPGENFSSPVPSSAAKPSNPGPAA